MSRKKIEPESNCFLKKPKTGDKVKVVYKIKDRQPSFGTVVKVIFKKEEDREICILKRSQEKFELCDCDFMLDAYKVEFEDRIIKKNKNER